MVTHRFETVAEDGQGIALALADLYIERGYEITYESSIVMYPELLAFLAENSTTSILVDVRKRITMKFLSRAVELIKFSEGDNRLVICSINPNGFGGKAMQAARKLGVGVVVLGEGGAVDFVLEPKDLHVGGLEIPSMEGISKPVRKQLALVHDKKGAGDLLGAYFEAIRILEHEARKHLKKNMKAGRIWVKVESNIRAYGDPGFREASIRKMTIGKLIKSYKGIVTANETDTVFLQALCEVESDRNVLAHKSPSKQRLNKMRKVVAPRLAKVFSTLRIASSA